MRFLSLFSVLLAICPSVFSQSKVIEGRIVADSLDSSLINIVNLTSGRGTSSEATGKFTIKASVNDSILFSSVQFKKKIVVVNSKVYKNAFLEVYLEAAINLLDEVKLPNLSGNLASDLKNMPINDKYALNAPMSLKMPISHEEKLLYTATTGPGGKRFKWYAIFLGSVPLDPIINGLSGRTKMLKKLNKNIKEQNTLETQLDLHRTFLIESCNLDEKNLFLFLNHCFSQPEYLELLTADNKLKLLEFYKKESKIFLKNLDKKAEDDVLISN
ncbi:hypothetical protein [Zunongwangia sp. HRR-M8]|uniref:hypothetical protein n=1 Tax=Zunongwangia sp. HRR-M8 TaxID=3015170 RepID=UPI0022DE8169|nr:hypothetical protein [Zunongwangia sp. HRR-M8]WBL21776.1 hypothetical protein PBT89_13735 [Zunongwangia sp. HRR-M8]